MVAMVLQAAYCFVYAQFFFFQAEDGIRDLTVTGVQTCALPISASRGLSLFVLDSAGRRRSWHVRLSCSASGIARHFRKTLANPRQLLARQHVHHPRAAAASLHHDTPEMFINDLANLKPANRGPSKSTFFWSAST